ncbi:hypothetical protein LTS12_026606, partial [Elasticomyces elasticus]
MLLQRCPRGHEAHGTSPGDITNYNEGTLSRDVYAQKLSVRFRRRRNRNVSALERGAYLDEVVGPVLRRPSSG